MPSHSGRFESNSPRSVAVAVGAATVLWIALAFDGRLPRAVGSAIEVARWIGASDLLIGLTIVAAGTSLPELMTSLVATYRGNTDIAVGNVIGSNIFNVFGILGICSVVRPQEFGWWVLTMDVPVMLISTLALVPLIRTGGVISRREGWWLLLGYLGYVCGLMLRGG